jgi:hypothetical protein
VNGSRGRRSKNRSVANIKIWQTVWLSELSTFGLSEYGGDLIYGCGGAEKEVTGAWRQIEALL